MDRGNVLSGAAFTAVLLSALAFIIVLLALGIVADRYVARSMTDEMHDDIQARWTLLDADFRDGGVGPLTELVKSAVLFTAQGRRAVGLFDADGKPVAGNILTLPARSGWQQAPLDISFPAAQKMPETHRFDFYFRSGALGPYTLVVGQRLDRLYLIDRALFRTLALSGVVVVLTMLGTGYSLSRRSLRKLAQLETALAQVSDGDIGVRVAVSTQKDQIDRVAVRVNAHLDTLSRLVVSTRATAAAIAHDLKSPLARAYLALGRAMDRLDAGQDPRAEIEDTQAELERMNGIFETFLRLARIESGEDVTSFAPVDLGDVLADLAETYKLVAEDCGQHFVYHRPEGKSFKIDGDALMLQQMVVNLLQNAVTHSGAGAEICLSLDGAGDRICLVVTDTGPGIPEAARAAVFEPFHRLDPSRNRPGSGLGLSMVRAIAERHGAAIILSDNAPGLRVVIEFAAA